MVKINNNTKNEILNQIKNMLNNLSLNGDEDINININIKNKKNLITNYYFNNKIKKRKTEYI